MNQTHILVVEDDVDISEPLAGFLKERGFAATVAGSAETADGILACGDIDLVLLDVMLPGESGLDLCRRLRASDAPGIIMMSALSEPADKAIALELGADDYVGKPFDLRELLARIRAVLRRGLVRDDEPRPIGAEADAALHFSGFAFYPHRRYLRSPAGVRIPLTGAEADLLLALCQNARKVLSREELIGFTRGEGFAVAARSVDILISRLRRKLAGADPLDNVIRTVRAGGYMFQARVALER
ncbi:response regulator transcription factor [Labrys wisconsinensis]|uniref:response regulator transcription factor n=1 Tax=Labrys wisconsinensis TaxID=425677 RepID=UPI0027D88363|nr:response regulator transcription factor [Labrys wisconsinensis]